MNKSYYNLCIEITRKCNLECEHCLRGCEQDKSISKETIDLLLKDTGYISELTFTGGEPLLRSDLIIYTIDQIIEQRISVSSFFIVSNGTIFNKELFFKLIEFYWYCENMEDEENSAGGFSCSIDEFHDNDESKDIIRKWKSLIFYKDYKEHTFNYEGIIDEGIANENGLGTRQLILSSDKFEVEKDPDTLTFEELVYINVNGEIVNDCDMSYQTQEENILGTLEKDNYYIIIDIE